TVHFGRAVRITADSLQALIARRTEPARERTARSKTRALLESAIAARAARRMRPKASPHPARAPSRALTQRGLAVGGPCVGQRGSCCVASVPSAFVASKFPSGGHRAPCASLRGAPRVGGRHAWRPIAVCASD